MIDRKKKLRLEQRELSPAEVEKRPNFFQHSNRGDKLLIMKPNEQKNQKKPESSLADQNTCHLTNNDKRVQKQSLENYKFYWKTNQQLNLHKLSPNHVQIFQFEDTIEQYLLIQHKEVITQQLVSMYKELQNNQCWISLVQQVWDDISNEQFAIFFFDQLMETRIFTRGEASKFKGILQRRKDWRKLFVEVFQYLDKKMYWQVSYIFYKTIEFLESAQGILKLGWQELEGKVDQYLKDNLLELKQRLNLLSQIESISLHLHKIVFTLSFLLNGIYVNKFYCNQGEKLVNNSKYIFEKEHKKRVRVLNCRRRISKGSKDIQAARKMPLRFTHF